MSRAVWGKILRVAVLLACLAVLAYGLFGEAHLVRSSSREGAGEREVNGFGFTEAATYDGLILKDGRLFDAYSAPEAPEGEGKTGPDEAPAAPKSCPT